MTDVVTQARQGFPSNSGVQNGSAITFVTANGVKQSLNPPLNVFLPSGEMITKWGTRFDEHYGGGAS